jgi:hypothetical protein
MGRLRALFAALTIFAVGVGASASPAAAVPGAFWGVVPQAAPTAEQFQRLKRGGVDSIRIPVAWGAVQQVQGATPDWSTVDPVVAGAATAGIEVLPFLTGAPSWAVRSVWVPGSHQSVRAPQTLPVKSGAQQAAWSSFLKLAAARYGPAGTFWAENISIPMRPIRTWQIWNEENFKYFVAQPNPADYGKLVTISSTAIKSVDPGAKLVLGGLFARPKEGEYTRQKPRQAYFATEFLEKMYRATPGVKSKFQGIALHPYTGTYRLLAPQIEEVRDVLKASHDADKGLWITELGWSSKAPNSNDDGFAKGVNGQAAQLKGAFSLLERMQRQWKVQRVYWFSVDDQVGNCNFCDGSGLFSQGFVPKKSWFAYVKFAGGAP